MDIEALPYVVTMIWRESTNHSIDCYFCMTIAKRVNTNSKSKLTYQFLSLQFEQFHILMIILYLLIKD